MDINTSIGVIKRAPNGCNTYPSIEVVMAHQLILALKEIQLLKDEVALLKGSVRPQVANDPY